MNIDDMDKVYLVMSRGGEYDDKWERVICARARKEDAEAMVAAMNARDQYLRDLDTRFRAHMNAWVPALTPASYPELLPRKKWPGGLGKDQITQAMRDERAAIDEENARRMIPYKERLEAQYLERNLEEIRYLTEVEGLTRAAAEDKTHNIFGSWRTPDRDVINYVEEIPFAR